MARKQSNNKKEAIEIKIAQRKISVRNGMIKSQKPTISSIKRSKQIKERKIRNDPGGPTATSNLGRENKGCMVGRERLYRNYSELMDASFP